MHERRLRKVYDPADILEAHILKGMLEQQAIFTHIGGYYLHGGIGEIPVSGNVTLWVEQEDVARARALIAEYSAAPRQ